MPFISGTRLGSYQIIGMLGAGGMGEVYRARDTRLDREVAVKVLSPEAASAIGPERFLREIEIASRLTHPHILPLHDSGHAEGRLFYVTPYIEGESLRERIVRERQLPLDDALRIGVGRRHPNVGCRADAARHREHRQSLFGKGPQAAEQLTFIGAAQAAGFELPEIKAILALELLPT
jgi:hypothetical protein